METVTIDASCPWCGAFIEITGKSDGEPEVGHQDCSCTINLDSWPSLVEQWQWMAGR